MLALQLSVLFLVFAAVYSGRMTCDRNDIKDGCSIPSKLPYFFKRRFTPSCNRHDICYSCGKLYKTNRKACDIRFRNHMNKSCKRIRNKLRRTRCFRFAQHYYIAVRFGGRKSYAKNPNRRKCRRSYVKTCI